MNGIKADPWKRRTLYPLRQEEMNESMWLGLSLLWED